jgi:Carboxypeptidase regulatory-like domain
VTQGRLRTLGVLILTAVCASFQTHPAAAQAKLAMGNLSGVVRDTEGTPQLGASVQLIPEAAGFFAGHDFLTNTQGIFKGEKLVPGFYTVRVTLAGYLPFLEKHVRITSNLTTVVRVQMESMFASLDQLRRQPALAKVEADDWKWVLRSSPSLRPILQWTDDNTILAARISVEANQQRPRARFEFSGGGARRPGSVSNVTSAPATAFAYDQGIGGSGHMLFAGQVSYNDEAPAGGIATIWLPAGSLEMGPHTALVLREARVAPEGPTFRGVRFDQGGTIALGDRALLRFDGEYVLVGLGMAASSLRPRMELDTRFSDDWHAALIFASEPSGVSALEAAQDEGNSALASALGQLDAFPALLWRKGHPVLESGWHEEMAVERKLSSRSKLQIAAFHDDHEHVALFGRGDALPAADYFQDFYSKGFAYDGGSSSTWGARLALREKLSDNVELTAVYAFAGALAPASSSDGVLRDSLRTAPRHSLGASIAAKIPRSKTNVSAGYKWVDGVAVSRVDGYGEALFHLNPYLHLGVRQPLPRFTLGHWEASADCDNLLAQGYVPINSRDGQAMIVPVFRSFRGGLSVQF